MRSRLHAAPAIALLALWCGSATARAEPAASDQEACTPDVFRLCSSAIPGEAAIVACLNAKVAQLSPACRTVIDPPKAKRKVRSHRS